MPAVPSDVQPRDLIEVISFFLNEGESGKLNVCLPIFLAFGYFLFLPPKTVFNGFKKGLNNVGIIDLGLKRSELMQMEFNQLLKVTQKEYHTKVGISQLSEFMFCLIISQIFLFSPFFQI